MLKKPIKAVLFDLDDTLYDEMTFVVSGFRAVADHLAAIYDLSNEKLLSRMMALLQEEGRGKIFDTVLKHHDLYALKRVTALVDLYRSHHPDIMLYADVKLVLHGLRQRGLQLGIITDGLHTVQKKKVSALNIKEHLDVVIYTDELGADFWKPHPAAFQVALGKLTVEPAEAIYVGNDPSKDFAGPSQLGMLSVQIHRNGKRQGISSAVQAHITDLHQLTELLDTWNNEHDDHILDR